MVGIGYRSAHYFEEARTIDPPYDRQDAFLAVAASR
jgi:hypothetical protein